MKLIDKEVNKWKIKQTNKQKNLFLYYVKKWKIEMAQVPNSKGISKQAFL